MEKIRTVNHPPAPPAAGLVSGPDSGTDDQGILGNIMGLFDMAIGVLTGEPHTYRNLELPSRFSMGNHNQPRGGSSEDEQVYTIKQ